MFTSIKHRMRFLLLGALGGAVVMTWLSPYFIKMMFTPAVNFGQNCAPAGTWSMQKLVYCQIFGLIAGALVVLLFDRPKGLDSSDPALNGPSTPAAP